MISVSSFAVGAAMRARVVVSDGRFAESGGGRGGRGVVTSLGERPGNGDGVDASG